jgi:hypothetical protein
MEAKTKRSQPGNETGLNRHQITEIRQLLLRPNKNCSQHNSAPVSTGNTFQELQRLRDTADNTGFQKELYNFESL